MKTTSGTSTVLHTYALKHQENTVGVATRRERGAKKRGDGWCEFWSNMHVEMTGRTRAELTEAVHDDMLQFVRVTVDEDA